jgi:hypothetical protein
VTNVSIISKNLPNHPIQFATLKIEQQNSHNQDPNKPPSWWLFQFHGLHPAGRLSKRAGFLLSLTPME